MSNFECPVVRVTIEPHANADSLECARISGYVSVVKKHHFKNGDLAVYIPEHSVLPDWLLKHLGFWDYINDKGMLSGSAGNRVRASKLRGVLSQGILLSGLQKSIDTLLPDSILVIYTMPALLGGMSYGEDVALCEGDCAAQLLGITKYEPQVPVHMAGRVVGGDLDATITYDFENIKKVSNLFTEGEQVVMTEKIHGTFVQVGLIPENIYEGKSWADKMPTFILGRQSFKGVVTSKGQGAKGLLLDTADETNLYVSMARKKDLWTTLADIRHEIGVPADRPIYILGELFGPGVQAGFEYGQKKVTFRAFDVYIGTRSDGYFLDHNVLVGLCHDLAIPMVPILYKGAFNEGALALHTNGNTYLTPNLHMREGVVIKSARESKHPTFGRKIAKSISESYLLRKGNQTEFN